MATSKGAAMAAGVPVVPIVIRNAEVIGARDSSLMNPGTVDVAVFPPVSVADWTVDDLVERIAGIRQLYLDTLKNWPADALPDIAKYLQPDAAAPATKAPAKKAPAKKVAAKKTPARKAVAKKVVAKKVVAKKVAAKKTPAKKAPTRETPRGRQ